MEEKGMDKTVKAAAIVGILVVAVAVGYCIITREKVEEEIPTTTAFYEDFESGTRNWDLEEGWHLETIDNNTVLRGSGHGWARLKIELEDNYTFRAKFKRIQGGINFNYRQSDQLDGSHQYPIRVSRGVSYDGLYLNKQTGSEFCALTYMFGIDLENKWHEIEIRGHGNIINVYFDNEFYLAYKDENTIMTGNIALETQDNSDFLIDNVVIKETSIEDITTEPRPEQLYGRPSPFIPDVTHSGDLVIDGTETMVIENENYLQQGNIYINDEAKLILRNSQLAIDCRGGDNLPAPNVYILVGENAVLQIENSLIFPEPVLATIIVYTNGEVNITDSSTSIHILGVFEGAQVTITNSRVVYDFGGIISVYGGDTKIVNSTIGAVGISIPADSQLETSGLKSGVCLENWDIHRDLGASNIPYNFTLENTYVLRDTIRPGGYERGWMFFIDSLATVKISDSELRKVCINFHDENINLENLKGGIPLNFKYKEIELSDVIVKGQWEINMKDPNVRDVTIRNSDILFIEISGQTNLNLIDLDIVEFGPCDFYGTIIFENSVLSECGFCFQSMRNNFTIKGSLRISPEMSRYITWGETQVTREFEVFVLDEGGGPIEGAVIEVDTETYVTDNLGEAKFSLVFNETSNSTQTIDADDFMHLYITNYLESRELAVVKDGETVATREVDFFTSTPIVMTIE